MGSERKAKRARQIREAKAAKAALQNPHMGELAKIPELLQEALKVNEALVEENGRLKEEIGNILDDHEARIAALEGTSVEG